MTSHVEIVHLTTDGKKTDGKRDINKNAKTNPSDVLKIYNDNKPMFIEFYANWCGHCKTLENEWEKLVKSAEEDKTINNLAIVSVESGVIHKDISKMQTEMKLNVNGFPTIGAIKNKKFIPYEGGRDATSMLAFIKADVLSNKQKGGTGKKRTGKRRTVKKRTVKRRTVKKRTVKRRTVKRTRRIKRAYK